LYYISTLNVKAHQGAYAGCSNEGKNNKNDETGVKSLCRNKKWTLYASRDDLHSLTYHYNVVGLDFIFSPFSILEHFFADKIKDSFALYALALPGSFSIAIFDGGKLEYAHHHTHSQGEMASGNDEVSTADFTPPLMEHDIAEGLIDLEDIESLEDLDIIDDLDSLGDIADLDELEEMHEFSEDMPTPEEKRFEQEQNSFLTKGDIDSSAEDYQRFEYIQKALQQFYSTDQCQNRFIETVCIADSQGGSEELKQYLEEELFLNVLVRKVDVAEEINALAMLEEGSA
ncbi:MAG TPA: hypothetical protein VFX57_07350, partial [Sulfuricurvum sp.]|nr:hypothetical protein [Sulfuricurvum sp.]